jgi:hypothetical protein
LLDIPITVILYFLVENYASIWPGKRGFEDDMVGKSIEELNKITLQLSETAKNSIFGEMVRQAIKKADHESYTSADLSRMAYSGQYVTNLRMI